MGEDIIFQPVQINLYLDIFYKKRYQKRTIVFECIYIIYGVHTDPLMGRGEVMKRFLLANFASTYRFFFTFFKRSKNTNTTVHYKRAFVFLFLFVHTWHILFIQCTLYTIYTCITRSKRGGGHSEGNT